MNRPSDKIRTRSSSDSSIVSKDFEAKYLFQDRIMDKHNLSYSNLLSSIFGRLKVLLVVFSVWLCMLPFCRLQTFAEDSNNVSLDIWVETDTGAPITPRQKVGYKLYVDNLGGESWIRVHISTSAENLNRTFGYEYINNADGWVRRGSYLYLMRKAMPASSILAIDGFTVPDTSMTHNATLNLSVWAEGIDVRAVTPDFSLEDPWKGHNPDTVKALKEDDKASKQETSSASSQINSSGNSGRGSSNSSGSSHSSWSGSSGSSNALNGYKAPTANALSSSGTWILADAEHKLWRYIAENGSFAKDGWYYIYNSSTGNGGSTQWFYFNNSGYMQTGWTTMNSSDWYHLHEISDGSLGSLTTGWYKDTQDNKTYYLDNTTGRMLSGWQIIGDKSYYFTPLSEIPGPGWIYTLISGTSFGRWLYGSLNTRSYGSMYINETTPDGSHVDINGAKITS